MKLKSIKEVRNFKISNEKIRASTGTSSGDTKQRAITGYACVFNQPSKLIAEIDDDSGTLITFYEVIMPNAFDDVLRADNLDVIYCIDHKQSKLIARTKANSLKLAVDKYGLAFEANVPDTSIANDLYENIRVGNYQENSFCFTVAEPDESWEEKEDGLYRYINKVSGLYDVSSVVNPAYNNTSLSLRGKIELKTRYKKLKEVIKVDLDIYDIEIFLAKNK
jgi:hypothetical protein